MSSDAPSLSQALRALLKMGLCRWRNRLLAIPLFHRKGRVGKKAGRTPTPPKRAPWTVLGLLLTVCMVVWAGFLFIMTIRQISRQLDLRSPAPGGRMVVSRRFYERMKESEADRERLRKGPSGFEPASPVPSPPPTSAPESRLREELPEMAEMWIEAEARDLVGLFGDMEGTEQRIAETYRQRGLDGFHPIAREHSTFLEKFWCRPDGQKTLLKTLGVLMLAICFMLLLAGLTLELRSPQWGLEWLFTFPLPGRVIFLARIAQSALLNPYLWCVMFLFLLIVFLGGGYGVAAVALALVGTFFVSLMLACVQVLGETWLRTRLSRGRLRNLLGLCMVLSMVLLFGVVILHQSPAAVSFLLDVSMSFRWGLLYVPPLSLLLLCEATVGAWLAVALLVTTAVVLPPAAARMGEWMVRGGLIARSGAYEGSRGPMRRMRALPEALRGIVGKEIRLLLRDRTFFAQVVVMPILLVAFQVAINPLLLRGARGDARHAAAMAFGMGAYVLMMSSAFLLVSEFRSLWILHTFPRRLETFFLRKAIVWAIVGVSVSAGVLIFCSIGRGALTVSEIVNVGIVIAGVGIFGCLSAGISILTADPSLLSSSRPRQKIHTGFLNMFLAVVYASAVYSPQIWPKLVTLALFVAVTCAVWQKVGDHIPFFLDPTASPRPSLSLSDGLIAVFAFFTLQGLLAILLHLASFGLASAVTLAYVLAGGAVTFCSLLIFRRRKIPDLGAILGLTGQTWRWRVQLKAVRHGLCWGGLAGVVGLVYLWSARWIPPLRELKEQTFELMRDASGGQQWLVLLAIVAAPVFEEYLFRGVLLGGLTRFMRPRLALWASAGLFAVVHPPLAIVPVFVLGVAAAIALGRSRTLTAPVVAHMIYNTMMLLIGPAVG